VDAALPIWQSKIFCNNAHIPLQTNLVDGTIGERREEETTERNESDSDFHRRWPVPRADYQQ
jgi:hypothetical protein